jgi:hypothetical protein
MSSPERLNAKAALKLYRVRLSDRDGNKEIEKFVEIGSDEVKSASFDFLSLVVRKTALRFDAAKKNRASLRV